MAANWAFACSTPTCAESFSLCAGMIFEMLAKLSEDPRVTVRTKGDPDSEGRCVVYWM